MGNLVKVEGHGSLRKDAQTSAVVNIDKEALIAAKKRKKAILDEKDRIVNLEARIQKLEKIIAQLGGNDG